MELEATIDAIRAEHARGEHNPAAWQGRLSIDEGYRVQLGLLERHVRDGQRHVGWKVGLTAKAMQEQQGFHEPVFGYLLAAGDWADGIALDPTTLTGPGFEPELCLTVGETLRGPGVTASQARAALSAAAPALEIIERRGGSLAADPGLAIADNVGQKGFVTGRPVTLDGALSLPGVTLRVSVNDRETATADGTAVLGDPAEAVAWLANKLAAFDRSLEAGMRIMSGSFITMTPLNPGDAVSAAFDPLGTVTARLG